MGAFGFIFTIVITVGINVFITAFLIARSSQSKKIIDDLQTNVQDVMRQVNRATSTHLTIADNTVKDLKTLIEEARRCSATLSRKVEKNILIKEKKIKEQSPTKTKKAKVVKKNNKNTSKVDASTNSLTQKAAFKKMIKEKLSDEQIAFNLQLSKAEVALARFVLQNTKTKTK